MAFTDREMKLAQDMLRKGDSFKAIARALGRKSGDGIKRQLDPAYRKRRNAYMAKWMQQNAKRK